MNKQEIKIFKLVVKMEKLKARISKHGVKHCKLADAFDELKEELQENGVEVNLDFADLWA